MERTAVNPVSWSVALGYNQGELVEGHTRTLYIAGQTAMDADGVPQHEGDMAGQLALSVENLTAVLAGGGMTPANLVRLTVYTTDVDELVKHLGALAVLGMGPAMSVVEVRRLVVPGQMVELEGTAVS